MLTDAQIAALTTEDLALLREIADNQRYNKLDFWQPFEKQWEFIALGKTCTERCLFAGNQVGKSEDGAYEAACHLTGLYPHGWPGHVFTGPTEGWACGVSTTVVRDVMQTKLFGKPGVDEELGTGMIPRHCIIGKPTLARGAVANSYDMANIRHFGKNGVEDGISQVWFKSYEQGREKFQGPPRHWIWYDEEPGLDIYTEGLARLTATHGISWLTFTPLLALSDVVLKFTKDQGIGHEWHGSVVGKRGSVRMEFLDNPNYTQADYEAKKLEYPANEWDARLHGLPVLGAGRVFTIDPPAFIVDSAIEIPLHWRKLWGCDFGINEKHPFAGVLTAWDVEADIFYVILGFKVSDALPWMHAERFRSLGGGIPIAWPHDGNARGKDGTGASLATTYRALQLPMLPTHARWQDASDHERQTIISTDRAVHEINTAIRLGKFRVLAHNRDWLDEYLQFHRDEKTFQLVKIRDDLLSATFKAWMMRRYGKPGPIGMTLAPGEVIGRNKRARRVGTFDLFTGAAT